MFIFSDSDLRFETPQIEFHIDHDKANRLGISMADIGGSLATLLGGNYVNLFDLYGRSYRVIPQVPRDYRLNESWLTRYQIRTASGTLVPLSNVATITRTVQPNALTNFQQLNSATLSAVPFPGRTVGEAIDFLKDKAKSFPEGFSYDFQGESRQFVQEGNTLVYTFIFALMVIFLVLAAQYESFRDPFIILVALPTSMFGALIPLNAGLASINIYTQIGLVTLIGLISKHGILMVDFANKLQADKGFSRRAAIEEAAAIQAQADPDDHGGHGGGHGAAPDRQGRGCREPLRYRRGDRRRHDHRHDLHPVRHARGLYLPRQGLSEGAGARGRTRHVRAPKPAPAAAEADVPAKAAAERPQAGDRRHAAARAEQQEGPFGGSPCLQFGGGSGLDREGQGPQGRPQASQAEAAQPGSRIVTGLLIPNEPLEVPG